MKNFSDFTDCLHGSSLPISDGSSLRAMYSPIRIGAFKIGAASPIRTGPSEGNSGVSSQTLRREGSCAIYSRTQPKTDTLLCVEASFSIVWGELGLPGGTHSQSILIQHKLLFLFPSTASSLGCVRNPTLPTLPHGEL